MTTSTPQFEGPRQAQPEELQMSRRLFQVCFAGADPDEYLAEAGSDETETGPTPPGETHIITSGGQIVSQIGIFPEQVQVFNGTLRLGSIGGVSTHPYYREHRLASRLMEHCTRRLVEMDARLLYISGGRGLYVRSGCVPAGVLAQFNLKPGDLHLPPRAEMRRPVTLRAITSGDAATCSQLYSSEAVHIQRPMELFEANMGFNNGYIASETWLVEIDGQPRAYLLLGTDWQYMRDDRRIRYLSEYAGSRLALASAVGELLAQPGMTELELLIPWQDTDFIDRIEESGGTYEWSPMHGHTMRIINFPGLQEDLQPYIQSRLSSQLQRGLRFEQRGPLLASDGGDVLSIVREGDRLDLNGADMTRLVLGQPGWSPPEAPGALGEIISALFPLPSFTPGLNYH